MSYTPGPWKAIPRHSQNLGDEDDPSGLGWDIEGPPEPMLRGQFKRADDARLVAASPDLLEACAELIGAWDAWDAKAAIGQASLMIRAAVAKALNKGVQHG